MDRNGLYTTYQTFLAKHFAGRVQKIPLDVGITCPVRDGTLATGGCSFCNGRSFSPDFCRAYTPVSEQIGEGKNFFARRLQNERNVSYLAYFQNGTNTHCSVEQGKSFLDEALSAEGICGVVLATRPDCLSEDWLELLESYSRHTFVMVEVGAESVNDTALRACGRGHDWNCSKCAIQRLARHHLHIGVHMILGLPGDTRATVLRQPEFLSSLPIDVVKLHQLQIMKGSRMADAYMQHPTHFTLFSPEEYAVLVADYLERLPPRIAVERFVSQAPSGQLIAPRWNLKADKFTQMLLSELRRRNSRQGCMLQ